jgi:hypothetical protein
MAKFMTRVELHDANYQDYVNLHSYMSKEGFSNTIRGDDGTLYQLPPAEYTTVADCTVLEVRDKASRAAQKTGKSSAVISSNHSGAAWVGLKKVAVHARAS